jgi:hypothetical protein
MPPWNLKLDPNFLAKIDQSKSLKVKKVEMRKKEKPKSMNMI